MNNLNILRIATKIENQFSKSIDLSDIKKKEEYPPEFYTRAIAAIALMKKCGIDADMASKSVTDGYHDLGIDAVYDDSVQKRLVIVQSKWRSDGTGGISNSEISNFVQGAKRLINFDLSGCNKKLKKKEAEIISALRDMDYQVEMVFVHTGNQEISDFCMRPVHELLAQVNDDLSEILLFSELLLRDIFDFLATGQGSDNICLDDVVLSDWGCVNEPFAAYYGTLPAMALGQWYKEHGNRLFAKNIRYYKGSTEVNQGIRNVLINEPENFFYYNNGVKILCTKITRKAAYSADNKTGLFSLEGVSLVNGAQTTGTIWTVFNENSEYISKARVFVQLIDLNGANEEKSTKITRLSNTQNRIDGKDFAALDPEQERIKTELSFAGIYYLYKSGAVIDDPLHQISLDEAIIAQACYQDDIAYVATAKRNIGALTENLSKPPYKVLFNSSTNTYALKNNVQVLRAVEQFISINESSLASRSRLALINGNRFILYLVLHQVRGLKGYDEQMIDNSVLENNVNKICESLCPMIIDSMNKCYPDAYPANIFKNVGRCKVLLPEIDVSQLPCCGR